MSDCFVMGVYFVEIACKFEILCIFKLYFLVLSSTNATNQSYSNIFERNSHVKYHQIGPIGFE